MMTLYVLDHAENSLAGVTSSFVGGSGESPARVQLALGAPRAVDVFTRRCLLVFWGLLAR